MAIEDVVVEYETMPVVGLDNALDDGVPPLHGVPPEKGFMWSPMTGAVPDGNTCYRFDNQVGSVDEALAQADFVVERDYGFPSSYQYSMEPHGAAASWDGELLEVWASCQHPYLVRAELARLFDLPLGRVRLHVPFLGGGFGSKSYTTLEPLASAAAMVVGLPVKIVNTIEESMQTSRQHNMRCRMLTAMRADGTLLARRSSIWMDTGAFATNGPTVGFMTGVAAPGPYRWEAVDVQVSLLYTNRPPAGSYRGFGSSHTQWISESQIDELARSAGLDPFEVRRRNLLRRGETVHPDLRPLDADLHAAFETVVSMLEGHDGPDDRGRAVGVGIGFGLIPAGADWRSNAMVRVRSDGQVELSVGTTELGQGARTVFTQIVADGLGVPMSDIHVPGADTSVTPYDRSTGASRSTTVAGKAVENAVADVVGQLRTLAAGLLGVPVEAVRFQGGCFSSPAGELPVAEVISALGRHGEEVLGRGSTGQDGAKSGFPVYWEACAGGAVVAEVDVLMTVGVPDVGKAINPQLVTVQDAGCTMQAIGQTLFEELEFADDGQLLSASLIQYQVPTTREVPEMRVDLIENGDGPGPFGAKGCGEGPFGAVPAAIVTGCASALGVTLTHLPLTPERVWTAIQERRTHGKPPTAVEA
jgi:CO/xanthine dehydrogenase Mo-binding subunit